jgi:hypothetical protein
MPPCPGKCPSLSSVTDFPAPPGPQHVVITFICVGTQIDAMRVSSAHAVAGAQIVNTKKWMGRVEILKKSALR